MDLQTHTDKDVYLKTEAITGLTNIANGQFGIEGGSLKVAVSRTKSALQSYQFVSKFGSYGTGAGQFKSLYDIAVDDNYIYVADFTNARIQGFNKSTYAYVGQVGFWYNYSVAIDANYIYGF